MFNTPRSWRKQGSPEAIFIFIAPEVVSVFGCPWCPGLQDVSKVVLDLVQCLALLALDK